MKGYRSAKEQMKRKCKTYSVSYKTVIEQVNGRWKVFRLSHTTQGQHIKKEMLDFNKKPVYLNNNMQLFCMREYQHKLNKSLLANQSLLAQPKQTIIQCYQLVDRIDRVRKDVLTLTDPSLR